MKKKIFRGYIFSREFMGERVPQNVQNLFIRDFCNKKNFRYFLSATEYAMESSSMVLAQVINELKKIDGIVAYSIFQLPRKKQKRIEYLQKIINLKKTFYGALEDLEVSNSKDLDQIEEIWDIKSNLQFCPINISKNIKTKKYEEKK
jgi:sporadic carbohydrate cluster protein (TIGR04323 family)